MTSARWELRLIQPCTRFDMPVNSTGAPDFGITRIPRFQYGTNAENHDAPAERDGSLYTASASIFAPAIAACARATRPSRTFSGNSVRDHEISPRRIGNLFVDAFS